MLNEVPNIYNFLNPHIFLLKKKKKNKFARKLSFTLAKSCFVIKILVVMSPLISNIFNITLALSL